MGRQQKALFEAQAEQFALDSAVVNREPCIAVGIK